jgi:ABC-2 type transport system ATP-binding protein
MTKLIEFNHVFKSFGKKKVLEKVSFAIEEGKFYTLIGCNGAGKSTTLRLLAGSEAADSGQVNVQGENPYAFEFSQRQEVFFVHEQIDVSSFFSLLEMVKIYRKVFPRWDNKIFNQFMKDRKISLKKNYADLSRGQKMQFLLMLGLAARPKLMLLDEVTAVIDIEGQRYFLDQLKDYVSAGGTVIITTNILSELNDYTDHLILLQETKLMVDSPVNDLQKKFFLLKQTEDHPVFKHPRCARIRQDYDGKMLYLIPRDVVDEDTAVVKFKLDHPPRLEDILLLHFQLKQEGNEDELVA